MGALQAREMAESGLSLRTALDWHLTSNHYPPVHRVFIDTAIEAIEHANEDDWDHVIEMPNGISKSVADIVTGLHLGAFIDSDE